MKGVMQDDAYEHNHANEMIVEKSFETTGWLSIASEPQMVGHHKGRNEYRRVVPDAQVGAITDQYQRHQHQKLQAGDDENVDFAE